MDNLKYVFVGNRGYVLKEMISLGLKISKVWVIENSFLHNLLIKDPFIGYTVIKTKKQLISELIGSDFDVLISNGCKYILPISELKSIKKRDDILFINVHPSCLPDLKGKDPINGACLFDRNGGATCHYMDDGIDTGSIITRIEILVDEDIDAGLLFQLSFKAEARVFKKAYNIGFECENYANEYKDYMYYSINDDDLLLDCNKGVDYLLKQSRAFGYQSKGIFIKINNMILKYFSAREIKNKYVVDFFYEMPELKIGIAFEKTIIFKLDNRIVRIDGLSIDNSACLEGLFVSNTVY